jgi:hypothetical protein
LIASEKPERPKGIVPCVAGFSFITRWFLRKSSNETMMPSTMAVFVLAAAIQSPYMHRPIFFVRRADTPRMNDFDLSVLTKRIETQKSSTSIPAIVMAPSCFLPGQKMQMHKVSAEFAALLRRLQVTERAGGPIETHTIAIMVLVQNKRPLPLGIQASVASVEQLENGTWEAALLAKRIIRFIGAVDDTDYERGDRAAQQGSEQDRDQQAQGWLIARVIPVDVKALDEQELELNGGTSRVLEFLSRELGPLVECWLDLVRSSDVVRLAKSGDELEALLEELGSLPGVHDYSARALWVGRLLNPGPMRVAQEMRSQLLQADSALERLYIARGALVDSVQRLKASEEHGTPLFVD